MSVNRENVIWKSKDGTWNRGFFDYWNVNEDDPDWDFEWDVEYEMSRFNWVSTGHATEEAARHSWDGANPGSSQTFDRRRGQAKTCDEFDRMAAALKKQIAKQRAEWKKQENADARRRRAQLTTTHRGSW